MSIPYLVSLLDLRVQVTPSFISWDGLGGIMIFRYAYIMCHKRPSLILRSNFFSSLFYHLNYSCSGQAKQALQDWLPSLYVHSSSYPWQCPFSRSECHLSWEKDFIISGKSELVLVKTCAHCLCIPHALTNISYFRLSFILINCETLIFKCCMGCSFNVSCPTAYLLAHWCTIISIYCR